jgi:hypothetical protein
MFEDSPEYTVRPIFKQNKQAKKTPKFNIIDFLGGVRD